jgi:hypothetical protein
MTHRLIANPRPAHPPRGARPEEPRRRRFRPALERLEERCLLTTSSLVYPGPDGSLIYQPDARGNRVPDFSMVGYQTGIVPLPDTAGGVSVPVQVVLSPSAGDQTSRIQDAINQVSGMPLDANGFRGAVLLTAGEYDISGNLTISASGVVLEGAGDDPAAGTILRATGTTQRQLIQVSGSGSASTVSGTTHNLIDNYVPVGARSFHVDSTANLHVGDTVIAHRPSPANWIHDIGMDMLQNPWQPNSKNLDWDRVITDIEGNTVTVDAPLTNSLEQQYGGGTIHRYTWSGRIQNVGLENFYAVSDSVSGSDQNHATGVLLMDKVTNAWVNNVTGQGFAQNVYILNGGAKWVTLNNIQSLDTSITSAAPPSGFLVNSQLTLIENSYVHNGYHAIAVGPQVPGPNVFVNVSADGRGAATGPHQRWSTGGLFDNVSVNDTQVQVVNAGNSGTGHGWEGANYVLWNVTDGNNAIQVYNPPTAQNWVIGGSAHSHAGNGIFDHFGTTVQPQSLYATQLAERLSDGGVDRREYWMGGNDNFAGGDPQDTAYVDPGWYNTVAGALGTGQSIIGFDDLTPNAWVPFSFAYTVPAGEQVVGGSLSLGLRRTGGSSSSDDIRVYLNSLNNVFTVGSLGWLPLSSSSTKGVVMDLSGQLDQLQAGLLNVALENNAGVAWAVLDLKLAPVVPQVDLSFYFSRIGLVNDGTTFSGGLDGHGYAYSANLLGSSVTAGGYTFNLGAPNAASAVQALGQTITLPPGPYSALAFLGTGVNGNQLNQTFTVNYTDGSSDTFTQSLSDWGRPQGYAGETIAVAMSYRDKSDGTMNIHPYNLYLYSLAVDSSKTVASLTLPADGNVEILALDVIPTTPNGAVQLPARSPLPVIEGNELSVVFGQGQPLPMPPAVDMFRFDDTEGQQLAFGVLAARHGPAQAALLTPNDGSGRQRAGHNTAVDNLDPGLGMELFGDGTPERV